MQPSARGEGAIQASHPGLLRSLQATIECGVPHGQRDASEQPWSLDPTDNCCSPRGHGTVPLAQLGGIICLLLG